MQVIEVTEQDIETGAKRDKRKCPIAKALNRYFPNASIEVTRFGIWIGNELYYTSQKIIDFIYDYDMNKKVQPFTFDLDELGLNYAPEDVRSRLSLTDES